MKSILSNGTPVRILEFIPDIGVDYGHLKLIELNWAKPRHKIRCGWAVGPHKTWDGQLRVWCCNHSGSYTNGSVHLCGIHVTRAKSLHPETELPLRLFSHYIDLSAHDKHSL